MKEMVSIIIPFYSRVDWLEEAVESVLRQTYQKFEIIIVNDGSSESVSEFLAKYNSKIIYFQTENKGPAHARNFGISKASGKFIAFLDSDDLWLPTKLEKQVKFMTENNLAWSHTNYFTFNDGDLSSLEPFNNYDFKGNVFPRSLTKLNIATPCVMVLREILEKEPFLRFSEQMRYGQDGYFWILLSVNNILGYVSEPLTSVRRTGGNAVQRAYVHLLVKTGLHVNLISKFSRFFPEKRISPLVRLLYHYCQATNRVIDVLYTKKLIGNNSREIISKIIYLPAYLMFKIL